MKIAIWWNVPCLAVSGIFRELAARPQTAVDVFLLADLQASRRELGWAFPDYGGARVRVLRPGEAAQVPLADYDFHVVCNVYFYPELNAVTNDLIRRGLPYGVMMEAPYNEFRGLKRLAKEGYLRLLVPGRCRPRSEQAGFIACLSGGGSRNAAWLERYGFPRRAIVPFGYFTEAPPVTRAAPGAASGPLKVLCTGYLTRNKGHHLLLDALRRLAADGTAFEAVFTGYGPERPRLERRIARAGLGGRVRLAGVVAADELFRLYAWADVLVAPGLDEPWGIRVNESLQVGTPVIVSSGVGAHQIVAASGGGCVVARGSRRELYASLRLLAASPETRLRMQSRLAAYRERLHPRAAADMLHALIRGAMAGTELPRTPPWAAAPKTHHRAFPVSASPAL